MKRITLLFFAMLLTTVSFAQGIFNLFGKSDDFFKNLNEKNYTGAQAFFDPTVQSKVTPAELQKLWENITAKLGPFEAADVLQSKTEGDFFSVVMDAKFAGGSQPFLLAYNKAEKLVGFFLQPKSNAANYLNPAYADTTLYSEKEVYVSALKHKLVARLTTPKGATNFPIVVLVHGSGPSDMDGTVGPNKPLKDLAAGLAAKGIASIRYVKRTMVNANEFTGAFTVKEETTDDAVAAVALAATIPGADKKQIYLLGHSLGGTLAPRIATMAPQLKGIILAEAPARKFTDLLIEQNKYLYEASKDTTKVGKTQLEAILKELENGRITTLGAMKPDSVILGLPASYWVDLNNYNPAETAKKLTQRILVIQGENDFQVSMNDYNIWNTELSKKSNVTMKLYPDINHLLSSQVEKGTASQYRMASSVSETLINDIVAWIKGG
jgi:pimeloyl-ACP methyl ester carboxylesterase